MAQEHEPSLEVIFSEAFWMRLVGMCDFDGLRFECVAESGYVDKDKKVKVVHVESTQLTVHLIEKS